jgi:AraC-like DNA-binding protein
MQSLPFGYQDKVLLSQYAVRDLWLLALRRGGKSHQLFAGSKIFEADVAKPQHRIDCASWLVFLRNCQQLQSPELPLLTATALLQNQQLPLCQLIQHAANLRQALSAAWYFRHQLAPYLFVRLQHDAEAIRLEFRAGIGLGAQQRLICELWFALILQLIQQQQRGLAGISLSVPWACPQPAAAQQSLWPVPVLYQQPFICIQIPRQYWLQPFALACPQRYQQALRVCRQQNKLLGKQRGILEFCEREIRRALPTLITQEQLADKLGLSSSSLKRVLQQHQTSFSQLVDDVRNQLALQLLQQPDLSNRQLAARLGYSDPHNFRRAFKRWTGFIPGHFRC